MTTQDLKETSRRVIADVYTAKDLALVDKLFHPEYVQKPVGYRGPEGVRRHVSELHDAFSPLNFELVGQIAEQDSVVSLIIMTGTHTGTLLGHIPASGREVTVIYIVIHRFVEGKIVEGVFVSDQLALMQQVGVVPTPVWRRASESEQRG